jgi:hypothetical protein
MVRGLSEVPPTMVTTDESPPTGMTFNGITHVSNFKIHPQQIMVRHHV